MTNLINKSEITAKTAEGVIEQVIEIARSRGFHMVEDRDDLVNDELNLILDSDWEDYSSRELMKFSVDGEQEGDWKSTITVKIFENFVDPGSEDYVYSVTAIED